MKLYIRCPESHFKNIFKFKMIVCGSDLPPSFACVVHVCGDIGHYKLYHTCIYVSALLDGAESHGDVAQLH